MPFSIHLSLHSPTGWLWPPSLMKGLWQFSNIDWFTTKASEIDCNFNQICDEIDLILGTSSDCDGNGTLDDCDIENGVYLDVDLDGIPDVCESDCNGNLVPDDSELEQGLELDCNGNGVPDSCDISNGLSPDGDGDGIPDECDTNYVINVSADGSGLFTDLQDAMELVLPGGTIQVTAGMYGPSLAGTFCDCRVDGHKPIHRRWYWPA